MRVLVCGGRAYQNKAKVFRILSSLGDNRIEMLIHGGAGGADLLAKHWAEMVDIPTLRVPAKWGVHGRAAGPIRNAEMIRIGRPHLVVAFQGGRGTANMIKIAEANNVPVWHLPEDEEGKCALCKDRLTITDWEKTKEILDTIEGSGYGGDCFGVNYDVEMPCGVCCKEWPK